jgi:LPXTG-motif cell wall-anchored protein/uncharacterized repeat protein (TIGR01451 family)
LTNVTIADTVGGVTINGTAIPTLAPGASNSTAYTGTYTLTQADVDAGTFTNIATATGTPPTGPNVTDPDDDTQTFDPDPSIELVKTGTLVDGGDGVDVGDTITYAFTVKNTGNVTLTNVTIADTVGGVTINGTAIPTLAPGASNSTAYTGTYTITQGDIDNGSFTNTATATGTPPTGPNVTDPDDDTQQFPSSPAILLAKTGTFQDESGDGFAQAGETITYAFVVANTGNVTLTNVTIADTVGGVTVTGDPIGLLPVGAFDDSTYTGSYTLTQADVDDGTFTNIATATGTPPSGPDVTDPDDDTQTFDSDPAIKLAKTGTLVDGGDGVDVGDTITYAFTVTNTGGVTLTNVTVEDTVGGVTITGTAIPSLAPGASNSTTYTGTYTITQGDIDNGSFTNTATATGTPPTGPNVTDPDDDTQQFPSSPSIELVKTGTLQDGGDGVNPGDTITYTFIVRNTGNVTLTNVTVEDTVGGVTINGTPIPSLAPGASNSTTYTGTYTITQGDIDDGSFTNTAEACGIDSSQAEVCVEDDHRQPLRQVPGFTIEKSTNGQDADTAPGPMIPVSESVTWRYEVQNTGNISLLDVAVSDDITGVDPAYVSGDDGDDILEPGELWVYKAIGAAVAGQYANVGTAEAIDPNEETVAATDPSHYFGVDSSIGLIKTGAFGLGDDGLANPGDTITYEFEVTNTGNVALTNIDVEDLDLGQDAVTCPNSSLVVGESMTCTAEYLVTQSDITTGSVNNCAAASGLDPIEDSVTDEDCFETVIGQSPSIAVVKGVEPGIIPVGEATEVTWTIAVTNTGNVPLSDVAITDALVATCDLTIGDLAVAASTTQTCTSTHTPDSLGWAFTNVAVATGVGPDGTTVTANDDADLAPIEVLGTAQLGDTVWLDTNKNGIQDSGEPGINGARVVLTNAAGTVVGTATTAKGPWDGWYKFVGLDAGRYTATLDTTSVSGALTTAGAFTIDLAEGQEYLLADFGVAETLPKTGTDSGILTWLGIGLLMIGGLAIVATRRRRFDQE